MVAAFLPLVATAEERNDTTVNYNDRQIVISEKKDVMTVKVLDRKGNGYEKSYEARYSDITEEETYFIRSPFYSGKNSRYKPLTPSFFIGCGTLGSSSFGFANNGELHLRGLGNIESGIMVLASEMTDGQRGWGMTYDISLVLGQMMFRKGYNLGNDDSMNSVVKSDTEGRHGNMKYYGMRTRIMVHRLFPLGKDRLGIGLGCSMDMRDDENSYWKTSDSDRRYAESAYLNMRTFGFGLDFQVSHAGFYLYAHKSLTAMFNRSVAPSAYPFTFGLGVTF